MLTIYNTYTQQKETFKPIEPNKVKLYVCGITVYDYCHLGHARVFVAFDAIVRFLRATGWDVHYVRNITDIDDKIIKRAQENKEDFHALTQRFIEAMAQDEQALGITPPNEEPRATDHIQQIIDMCEKLVENNLAYVGSNGDLFYKVADFEGYGSLANKDLEKLQAGVRVEVQEAKENPLDFVLWKQSKAGEPSWDSPWGQGRPGWHIECSAMSTHCLGNHFDIHGGGNDLIFPHHENERAQSMGANNEEFVNTWMHMGFVQVNKEKMSKSLGNFFTIREILAQYPGEVIRYFLLASHYRSPLNFSDELLDNAKSALSTLYTALRGLNLKALDKEKLVKHPAYKTFVEVMNDDFNVPKALSVLFELARNINTQRQQQQDVNLEANLLKHLGDTLGVLQQDPEAFFQGDDLDAQVEDLIKQREQARVDKQWARADEIRDELLAQGIVLEDSAGKTLWRRK
jgi:cysteinyl-tRNA synthetase